MKNEKGGIKLGTIIVTIILLIILVYCFNIYKANYFTGFQKATAMQAETKFIRDSKVKYSKYSSYKMENIGYNDSTFYKEIEVEPNTPYKISCMVKTENVECKVPEENGGATIGLLDTTEYSEPIAGTNDWQPMEFMFNSKNRKKVKISFRLGGNENDCMGTVWFSDIKLEKGIKSTDNEWNVGCFIIRELDVTIDGKQYNLRTNLEDIENVKLNMARYKEDCYNFSNKAMTVKYEVIQVKEPITNMTYSEEHGYYLSYKDVKEQIYKISKEKQYDHIFVVCRMEDEEGKITIPIHDNWIGLGGMDMYGIGYSLIRINKNSNIYTYKYGITNELPEEVYIHEFLHTLERNSTENGYEIPALHDYEKYGYSEKGTEGLTKWYKDYMKKQISDKSTGTNIGLSEFVYTTQPTQSDEFRYPIEIEICKEPQNIFDEIQGIIEVLKINKAEEGKY